jgi:hypothetical protein
MEKRFRVVPRGVALVVGCCTFPTWNGLPRILREPRDGQRGRRQARTRRDPAARDDRVPHRTRSLAEAGMDPNVADGLFAHGWPAATSRSSSRCVPEVASSTSHARSRERPLDRGARARQAQVYTRRQAVNQIILGQLRRA